MRGLTEVSRLPLQPYHSLYLHVPFCRNICDYCALYSVEDREADLRSDWLRKMRGQLSENADLLGDLRTVYIGGGTPTQLRPAELHKFVNHVASVLPSSVEEWTVECNPSVTDLEKLQILRDAGVNRLSFGAQSTTRATRKKLGRRTGDRELSRVLELAAQCGFENLNADLIYGVPGQTLADWQFDLETLLSLPLTHFSAYSLILEEGTPMAERHQEVDDDLAVEMYELCGQMAQEKGFGRYEVSNYARPGRECQHNLAVWFGHTYLGLGPAAAGFDGNLRVQQIADIRAWLQGAEPELDELPQRERLLEVIAFGFRVLEGWKKQRLAALYGKDCLRWLQPLFLQLQQEGLLCECDSSWKPTAKGLRFADEIAERLITYQEEESKG